MTQTPTRRSVLRGFGLTFLAGAAGFVVARRSDAAKARPTDAAANAYGNTGPGRGRLLTALDKVPLDGGLGLGPVVLTRDSGDGVSAFSSTCTHQGCTVSGVRNGRIECP